MRRFIIDTDTASDDAVALMMALWAEDVTVDAITTVAGNVPLAQASNNAGFIVELCQKEIPVHNGCDRPWLQTAAPADWFHGPDGMGGQHYPAPNRPPAKGHAANELIKRFGSAPGQISLVTLGPLTNIATALALEPDLAHWVSHCFIMGGAANCEGNVTPAAEYNIWCDPEAAARVLQSGMRITLLGWELSRGEATLDEAEIRSFRDIGTRCAHVAMDCNITALEAARSIQGEAGLALADPVAMAVALDRTMGTSFGHHAVEVVCGNGITRGMTVVDRLNVTGQPANADICFSLDAVRWKTMLRNALEKLP